MILYTILNLLVCSLKVKNTMEVLHVALYKPLCIENSEFKVIARLQRASDESHTTDVVLFLWEKHIFIFWP